MKRSAGWLTLNGICIVFIQENIFMECILCLKWDPVKGTFLFPFTKIVVTTMFFCTMNLEPQSLNFLANLLLFIAGKHHFLYMCNLFPSDFDWWGLERGDVPWYRVARWRWRWLHLLRVLHLPHTLRQLHSAQRFLGYRCRFAGTGNKIRPLKHSLFPY